MGVCLFTCVWMRSDLGSIHPDWISSFLLQKHSGPESSPVVVIQERRLHVGVHNGWGFLERPQVVVLETTEATDWSRGRTKGGTSRQGTLTRDWGVEGSLTGLVAVGYILECRVWYINPVNWV